MTLNRGFLLAVLVVVAAAGNASAATYIVGDNLGWVVPPSAATYAAWASRHVFRVGDVLVFNYSTGFHDVARVTKAAFDSCSSNNPIALATVGPSNFTLTGGGEDYYICTFGTHCLIGQKLAINVTAAASTAPAPPPSTTPITPTPTMPPSTTPITPTPTMPPSTTPAPTMPPSTTPAPTMPPSTTPAPSSSPSQTPSLSPSGAPAPGSTPTSPMPSGGVPAGPPAPASESTPGGSLSPPPSPSSATIASLYTPLVVVFASVAFALMI